PPGPFSNPVVKPTRADGTGGAAPWESRSSPTTPCLRRTAWFPSKSTEPDDITGRAGAELAAPAGFDSLRPLPKYLFCCLWDKPILHSILHFLSPHAS